MKYDQIWFIPGIISPPWYQKQWEKALYKTNIPFWVFSSIYFYLPTTLINKKIEILTQKIKNSSGKILIIAHSFGGILSKTALSKCQNINHIDLITLASPHGRNWKTQYAGCDHAKEIIHCPTSVPNLIATYSANNDFLVHQKIAQINDIPHLQVSGGHNIFLFSPNLIYTIISNHIS